MDDKTAISEMRLLAGDQWAASGYRYAAVEAIRAIETLAKVRERVELAYDHDQNHYLGQGFTALVCDLRLLVNK